MASTDISKGIQKASAIVAEYGALLEHSCEPGTALRSESHLPHPKGEIRRAIELLLLGETNDATRNTLEVGNVLLDSFVPDEDYAVVQQQCGGLSEALQKFYEGNRDGAELVRTIRDGCTKEGAAQLHIIEERVERDSQNTLKRNRELRQEASALRYRQQLWK